jgi:membrane-bound metal-dependent hydrolase YbcI (DUF457 family)
MPSPIGHALAGAAIAPLAGRGKAAAFVLACAALAALPDIDLLFPGFHRSVTHSVGATILVTIMAMAVTGWVTGRINWRVSLVCGAAYGSHLLLDWLARDPNPPYGIQALWPFSQRWFISGWNIFPPTERDHLFSARAILINLRAIVQEVVILGPIAVWSCRAGRAGKSGGAGR